MEKIKVIKLEPDKMAEIVEIENTLEAKQEIVGGLIEVMHTFDDSVCIIANEEARCIGMDLNRSIKDSKGNLPIYFSVLRLSVVCQKQISKV